MSWIPPAKLPSDGSKSPPYDIFIEDTSILPEFLFTTVTPILDAGNQRQLETDDFLPFTRTDNVQLIHERFDSIWQNQLKTKKSLFWACMEFSKIWTLRCFIYLFLADLADFGFPWAIENLLNFVETPNVNMTEGFLYLLALVLSSSCSNIFINQYYNGTTRGGLHMETVLKTQIYKKVLRLSNFARKKYTDGEIINLSSVDCMKCDPFPEALNVFWSAFAMTAVSLGLLWRILGKSLLSGFAVFFFFMPVEFFVAKKVSTLEDELMTLKDKRMKAVNEALQAVQIIKFFVWEDSFLAKISKARNKEVNKLKWLKVLEGVNNQIMDHWVPTGIMLATYITFVLTGNSLTSASVFTSLALFKILRHWLMWIPWNFNMALEMKVSLDRIQEFLLAEELDRYQDPKVQDISQNTTKPSHSLLVDSSEEGHSLESDSSSEFADALKKILAPEKPSAAPPKFCGPKDIQFNACDFAWKEEAVLKDINLHIKDGQFVVVIGRVGAGKSSLVSACLGEMKKLSGNFEVPVNISYVSQIPPIFQTTLKRNILMESPRGFDSDWCSKSVFSSGLEPDIALLKGGLNCEIREKSLSGGQRLRVGLARALYNEADVYLLDDVFSAVDVMVARHIFKHAILGMLKDKTRILVTHQEFVLPYADWIIQMEDGEIKNQGTYEEMKVKLNLIGETGEVFDSSEVGAGQMEGEEGIEIEEEVIEVGSIKLSVAIYYMKLFGQVLLGTFILLVFISEVLSSLKDWWISHWSQSETNDDIWLGLGVFIGISSVYAVFGLIFEMLLVYGTQTASKEIHKSLLRSILRGSSLFFNTTPIGRILNRFSKDQEAVDTRVPRPLKDLFICLANAMTSVVIVCISNPYLAIGIIPLALIYYKIQDFFRTAMRQVKRYESTSASPVLNHLSETLHATTTIRAFRLEQTFSHQYFEHMNNYTTIFTIFWCCNRWLNVRLGLCGLAVISSLGLSGLLAKYFGTVNTSLFGLALVYSVEITSSLNWVARQVAEMEISLNSVERIQQYIDIPHESARSVPDEDDQLPVHWPEHGQIEFDQVEMRYAPELEPALSGTTFTINAGEKVGICGRTGAGKSTILNVLFRFQELSSGSIKIDGVDISKLGLDKLRRGVSIIPQTPILFSGTLRQNLDPFGHFEDQTVWNILESVGLKAKIAKHKEGLDFELDEGGENFSVGERQLLCMARALCEKSRIILLDEATAACDKETDEIIQKTIREKFVNGTVVTIAHRIHTIVDYDKIIVMEKGKVKEIGTPQELLKDQSSRFYQLWKNQPVS